MAGGTESVYWEGFQVDELGSFCPSTVLKKGFVPLWKSV